MSLGITALTVDEPKHGFPNPTCMPSRERAEEALLSLPLAKAVGPDSIPSEVIRVGGLGLVDLFYGLLIRNWTKAYVPVA